MSKKRAVLFVLALGLFWALLDQSTKYLAVAHLTSLFPPEAGFGTRLGLFFGTDQLYHLAHPPVEILPPVWNHVYVQNPAGAFGLLRDTPLSVRRAVFTGVAFLAAGGILWMASRSAGAGRERTFTRIALGLVFGGAVGNLTDRIVHGYVIDFIDWHWKDLHWPAFNIADVGIVVGVFALVFLLNRVPEDAPAPAGTRESPEP